MESLNSDNSLQAQAAPSCPFYSVVPHDNMANTQLPRLKPAAEPQPDVQTPDNMANTTKSDWVVEPNSEQQILVETEFQKLLALNEELRAANNDLYEEVEHLKDDFAESEKALQWQKRRSSVAESMLNQQTQELAAAQEQIKSLFQELETSVQTVQRQENLIETYKTQLQISEQRLAKLERECALLQTNYNEQAQQASQSENTCRELRSRLMRQQRQTLQFKAALEKCLETPAVNDSSDDTANHQTRFSRKARSLFPNVQPIRPWSAESEADGVQLDSPWGQCSTSPPCSTDNSEPIPSSPENSPVKEDTPPPSQPVAAVIDASPTTSESISSLGSSKLDDQLDSLIQLFFTSESVSASPPTAEINLDSPQTEALVGETQETTVENVQQSETLPEQQVEIFTVEEDSQPSSVNHSPESSILPLSETTADSSPAIPLENYWLENAQVHQTNLTANDSWDYANDTQSPSPVVYPQRPPKGRKSLSSVELPNFRPSNQSKNPQ
ncbi:MULTISPECIES: hypothetical protein [Cyanophyceae]|uniref:hypothetical protein n=1 Tax=Cyanophyceae TaxID=3028117 RepID=UPI00232C08E9|nr:MULTISPECIES: hypothetical protein [Cyanophyceae]MDB9339279.1 hypothetical protein [Nodularia spumigena CS-589/07]MDB9356607.1 hypothetical protein [Nodularia spumigena CS-587/03]MDB9500696.1 hypothetical protein [Nodularia spumigena CS-336/02]MDB9530503.1 hypothetical protein [Nodularia spumigena CS-1038]